MSTEQKAASGLLSGKMLAKNTIWNMTGMATPILVAVITIPMIIHGMGKDRYGLLGIIWLIVGYFGLFDMGLGRALTKFVAEYLGKGQKQVLPDIIWSALWMILGLGIVAMLIVFGFSGLLITHVLNVPKDLQFEGHIAFCIAGACIPVVIITAALTGVLEAHQKFAQITRVRLPLGIMTYLGPLITLQFTPSLIAATGILVLVRGLAMVAYFFSVLQVMPGLRKPRRVSRMYIRRLLSFGGWLTVSNIFSPLMKDTDRFFIGALLTMTAVTYYTVPCNILGNLQILPSALLGVMFPALTTVLNMDRSRLPALYARMTKILVLLVLLATSFALLFAPEILQLWLGDSFRQNATLAMQIFAFGWMVNAFAQPSQTVLQSCGRPDLPAKAYLCKVLPYFTVLYLLTKHFGIAGTAATWAIRVTADTIIYNEMTKRVLPELRHIVWRCYLWEGCVIVIFAGVLMVHMLTLRCALYLVLLVFAAILLLPEYRAWRAKS